MQACSNDLNLSIHVLYLSKREYGIPNSAREGSYGHYAETMRFRSISPMLAWQEQSKAFLDPITYLINERQPSPFDSLIRVQSLPKRD